MKRSLSILLLSAVLAAPMPAVETDAQATAHKVALELAGAFSNDGFKLRDGHWTGSLEIAKTQVIQVNLFAGNQYWFSLAATSEATKIAVTVFDETGRPMSVELYADQSKAAAGFSPDASGPYYLEVREVAGSPATFCLIYSYK